MFNDYFDTYIIVTGNIAVEVGDENTKVAFKSCTPFRKCKTEMNDTFVEEAEFIDIAMPMYNLIEYSDNYSETSGRLRQFKRYEIEGNVDLTVHTQHIPNNSLSFKNKSNIITDRNGVKIAVPLKNLSNFSRSIEMPLINCKVELKLRRDPDCVLPNLAGASTFTITDAKLYVRIVTLSTEDNAKLSNQLSERFKRPIYWNNYKVVPEKLYNTDANIREKLDFSCQGVKRLFVLAYECGANRVTVDSHRIYFLRN